MSEDVIVIQNDDMRVTIYKQPRYPNDPTAEQTETLVNIVRGAEDITLPATELGRLITTMKAAHSLALERSISYNAD